MIDVPQHETGHGGLLRRIGATVNRRGNAPACANPLFNRGSGVITVSGRRAAPVMTNEHSVTGLEGRNTTEDHPGIQRLNQTYTSTCYFIAESCRYPGAKG
ncbi:hypothetical protein GCM10023191_053960 [Actinoallomurus oryzae]|uniref:Uncharacterized protein n=1 Tax=Actinoallomurus oryzae TaxID=502180 RepID=A0ABP8QGZ3_9ACTN